MPPIRDTLLMDKSIRRKTQYWKYIVACVPAILPRRNSSEVFPELVFLSRKHMICRMSAAPRMNYKLHLNVPTDVTILRNEDILSAVKYLIDLKNSVGECSVDDIDHLGNRRVRSVGSLLKINTALALCAWSGQLRKK